MRKPWAWHALPSAPDEPRPSPIAIPRNDAGGASNGSAAQADLAQLDSTLPPSSHLRADMAHVYVVIALVPEALRQYDLWVSTHPNDLRLAGVLNNRCWTRARLNIDLPLALADCKEAVDKDGGHAGYRDSLGWTFLRLSDAANAKSAFDGAIKLQAQPFALYGRALANVLLNDMASGERDLQDRTQAEAPDRRGSAQSGVRVRG